MTLERKHLLELAISVDDLSNPQALFGSADRYLRQIRAGLNVRISARDSVIRLSGDTKSVTAAAVVIETLQTRIKNRQTLSERVVGSAIQDALGSNGNISDGQTGDRLEVYVSSASVSPRTAGQKQYLKAVQSNDLTLCLGPAGTGKTYIAVAFAVSMLKQNAIKRIVLVRPAVEAGEKLGYLPGDLQAKVNPYLRPLMDAMHDMMSFDQIKRFMQNDVIEIIPLAFMRGRTLSNAVIILDEAQNSTASQMMMFLTRLGHDSKMIVTGDDSQIDLAPGQLSGVRDASRRLRGIEGIAVIRLEKTDIVRHALVHDIVEAYGNGSPDG
ncbi:MAG: PhoH family protein [Planctomycetes bacterium]|nr:PhoH family protein [Planctomycetota bacterium]